MTNIEDRIYTLQTDLNYVNSALNNLPDRREFDELKARLKEYIKTDSDATLHSVTKELEKRLSQLKTEITNRQDSREGLQLEAVGEHMRAELDKLKEHFKNEQRLTLSSVSATLKALERLALTETENAGLLLRSAASDFIKQGK